MQGQSSGLLEELPADVKRRVKALKNLQARAAWCVAQSLTLAQVKHASLAAEFEKEVAALELKYHALHAPLVEQRTKIVAGDYEPTEEEVRVCARAVAEAETVQATFEETEDEEDDDEEDEKKKEEPKCMCRSARAVNATHAPQPTRRSRASRTSG